jgi:DNA-binding response OmpR family regulator
MDGSTVPEALSSRRPEVPVLIHSASSDLRTRAAAFSRDASDYLEKPFAFDDLLARVRTHLRRGVQTAFEMSAP